MTDEDQTRSFISLTNGTIVSQYKIISKIGAGGMGEVYLAEDKNLSRKVALKFLSANLSNNEEMRARFTREAKAAAKLDHPNIIPIYEVGEYNGHPFFSMAQIEGKSLREVIKDDNLSINDSIEYIMQICAGLSEAHSAGVVHRDIKPANIIIDKNNKVRIVDFGLAEVKGEENLTKTGSTLGTVGYMSPEQITGRDTDHRSDLFSVGVILYEMITGRRPFAGDNEAAVARSVTDNEPEPIERYKAGSSIELQQIINKALSKDPGLRYQNAQGMLVDLKRMALSTTKKPVNQWKKYSITAAFLTFIVLLLVFKPWKFEISSNEEAFAQENLLAIMYFDNLADRSDSLSMGEIATNLLITDLSESEYINVVSSQRLYEIFKSFGYEGAEKIDRALATDIAKKANSKWMLLGSILQVKPTLIITSQLVDVTSGSAIASQRIDGQEEDNIFSIVDNLSVEIKKDLSLPEDALLEHDVRLGGYTESTEAYRDYIEGWKLLFEYNQLDANNKFKAAVEKDSNFAMAYFGLSWTEFREELQLKAISNALQFTDNLNEIDRHSILARRAQLYNDYEGAIKELQKILEKSPFEKDIWNWTGVLYKSIDHQKALESFKKVIELDSTYKMAFNELAYLYNRIGNLDSSIWAANKYIALAPNEPNPYDTRGQLYALNGKLDEAIASYEKALQINPNFVQSKRKLGDVYMFNQQYDKADSLYRELTSHADKNQRSFGRLLQARLPVHQGKFQEALQVLDIGIKTDLMELGEVEVVASKFWVRSILYSMELKRYDLAIEDIKKTIEIFKRINPKNEFINHLLANLARYYAANDQYDLAERTIVSIKENIELNESDNYSNYDLAHAFVAMEKGEYGSFSKIWKLAEDRRFFASDYHFGFDNFHAGRISEAVHTFERTIKTYDGNRAGWPALSVKVHYWLGRSYEASGWNDKAIEQYETFLDIWKNADDGLEIVDDARDRLANLKNNS